MAQGAYGACPPKAKNGRAHAGGCAGGPYGAYGGDPQGIVCTRSPSPQLPPFPTPPPPPLPPPPLAPPYLRLASLHKRLASLKAGAGPCTSLKNNTLAAAVNRLVCASPCVCTALFMPRLVCGPPVPLPWLTVLGAEASPHTLLKEQDSCGGHKLPSMCTPLCMYHLVCGPPNLPLPRIAGSTNSSLQSIDGSLYCVLDAEAGPRTPPLNNKTPVVVAGDCPVFAPPFVGTAWCVPRCGRGGARRNECHRVSTARQVFFVADSAMVAKPKGNDLG